MRLVSMSKRQYYNIKSDHPNASIKYIGELQPNKELYIKNKINEENIIEFTENILEFNNFNSSYFNSIFALFSNSIVNSNKVSLNTLYKKLTTNTIYTPVDTPKPVSLIHISQHFKNDFQHSFFSNLLNLRLDTVGKGELYFALLTDLINGTSSDLKFNDLDIEVKNQSGRLRDIYGYDSGNKLYTYLETELKTELTVPQFNDLNMSIDSWNFNQKNSNSLNTNINRIIEQNQVSKFTMKNMFKSAFLLMYNQCPDVIIDKFVNNIFSDYLTDHKLISELLIFQFEYYQYIKQFDYLLLMNSDEYIYIKDKSDFINKMKFINYSGFTLKHERSSAFSLSLKKSKKLI